MIKFQSDKVLVCFGGAQHSLASLQSEYKKLKFKKIKQIHSDIVIEASEHVIEADAHFTVRINEALLINTADCMPIMIYCEQTHRAAAVHAGWRGVVNKITEKTLINLINTGSTDKKFKFWIGPHILQQSFEVDTEVYASLSKSQYGLKSEDFSIFKNSKYLIDLKKIIESQIRFVLGFVPDAIFSEIDTKTNLNYYSYRRERKTIERNLSFICLLA